jgi:hypothetical protein
LHLPSKQAQWLNDIFQKLIIGARAPILYSAIKTDYESAGLGAFDDFTKSKPFALLRENGLLIL